MFCSKCGTSNADTSNFCVSCGSSLVPASSPVESWQSDVAAQSPMTPPPATAAEAIPPKTSGKAIASLVLGLLFWMVPAAIAAVILGHISRSEIRRSAGRIKGGGLALTGLVLGYVGVAMIPFLIIAAIAIPNLLRSRIAANEASAVGSVRTLNVAQITYAAAYPNVGFTCTLTDLGSQTSGSPSSKGANLIDGVLAGGKKSGYTFTLSNCEGRPGHSSVTFVVVATPITAGQTGIRAFCSDQTGVIRYDKGGDGERCLQSGLALR